MRRNIVHPYGQSRSGTRIISMLMALLVLSMLYQRLRDPSTWRAFADDKESQVRKPETPVADESEQLIPGPNDRDEEEFAKAQLEFEKIVDKAPLKQREMDLYWKFMDWIRTEPLADLEKRAHDDIPFAQFYDRPDEYRGKLVYLRMHLRRVSPYQSTEYPAGIKLVCEAWGWTDDSLSFPYVVVFPDPPANLPRGQDIRAEVVFTGYFLKLMRFTTFDGKQHIAPLLVGRVRVVSVPQKVDTSSTDPWTIALVGIGGLGFIGYSVWFSMKSRRKPRIKMLPNELSTVESSDDPNFSNLFEQIVTNSGSASDSKPVVVESSQKEPGSTIDEHKSST